MIVTFHFLYLVDYFLLAGQAVFYLLCFKKVFGDIPANDFIGIRKLADPILEVRLRILYYSGILLGLIFVVACCAVGDVYTILCSGTSYLLLITDVILAKRYNIPINATIRDTDEFENDKASELQSNWLRWIGIRGAIIVSGFIILLAETMRR